MNENSNSPALVPAPRTIEDLPGHFTLGAETAILAPANLVDEARRLQQVLRASIGFDLPITHPNVRSTPAALRDATSNNAEAGEGIDLALDASLNEEAYTLNVGPHRVEITGGSPTGVGHGVSTLLRMFPAEVFLPHL